MRQIQRLASVQNWTVTSAIRVRNRLRITWVGMVALVCALAATAISAAVFVAVAQDVIAGDGIELRDASNLHFVLSHRSQGLVEAARLVTNLGNIAFLIPLAVAAALFLWFKGAPLVVAIAPVVSLGTAGLLAALGKQLVGRTRPPMSMRLVSETESSFPSGHSTDSAAFYIAFTLIVAVILLRRPVARVLTVGFTGVLVFAVGSSRLVLGVHWPTDVIAGWALGVTVALIVTMGALLLARQVPPAPLTQRRVRRLWGHAIEIGAVERKSRHAVASSPPLMH